MCRVIKGARTVLELSLDALRRHLLAAGPRVLGRLQAGLLAQVARDRSGDAVDGPTLRQLLHGLAATGLYQAHFQQPLVDASEAFFAAEGARMVGQASAGGVAVGTSGAAGASSSSGDASSGARAAQFLLHVEQRLFQVGLQCETYLAPSSRRPLLACVELKLLAPHLPTLLEEGGGFDVLVQQVPSSRAHRRRPSNQ
jgi:hypothetical protein